MNATVGGWPSGSTLCFTPMLFPKVLHAKQGNSMYHTCLKSWVSLERVSNPDLPRTKRAFYHWEALMFYLFQLELSFRRNCLVSSVSIRVDTAHMLREELTSFSLWSISKWLLSLDRKLPDEIN